MKKTEIKAAFRDTMPVLAGYLVLGIGFGVMFKTAGFGIRLAAIMSLTIFAGSMQYAAVGLLASGASIPTVVVTTLAVNIRHLFYGLSMIDRYRKAGIRKLYMIFGLTDETYSLVCSTDRGTDYCFFVTLFDHIYWITGSVLGAWLGGALRFNSEGIDFALTALFITVFTDQWLNTKDHVPAVAGVICSVLCLVLFGAERFLAPAMIAIAVVLLVRMKKEKRVDDES